MSTPVTTKEKSVDPAMDLAVKLSQESALKNRIRNDFNYHKPGPDEVAKMAHLRAGLLEIAMWVADNVPAGREQALVLTHLENAMMFANAGITRSCPISI